MKRTTSSAPVIGIAGWKKSGKTTLVTRLIEEFTRRGLKVATVKHAHHNFQIDGAETDSARHRRAGAAQVAIVSRRRWAMVTELEGIAEPGLTEAISWLDPCDLVIVEGYKSSAIPKIEVRRAAASSREPLAPKALNVIAIAADHDVADAQGLATFALDDVATIADFIAASIGLRPKSTTAGAPETTSVATARDTPAK
jgi:molybdopterin-guanine dinucleotide biosynthesis protein B